jgi:hypothetical protein
MPPRFYLGGLHVRLCWRPFKNTASKSSVPVGEAAYMETSGFGQRVFADLWHFSQKRREIRCLVPIHAAPAWHFRENHCGRAGCGGLTES